MKVGLDTSCLVPLMSSWHEHHKATLSTLEALKKQNNDLIVAAPAVLECFSVLTRLPERIRITPSEAAGRLSENIAQNFQMVGVDPETCWAAMQHLTERDLGGGLIYDAIIAHSCASAGATILLTWDVLDFRRVAPAGLTIQEPLS